MLEKIDIHIVDHCNLNCKGCNHLSPIADEFYLNIDDFEKDIKRLSVLTGGNIGTIFLLGGEPLLHPELTDFFPIVRNLFRNSRIVVFTNGILLNQQEDKFWNSCRRSTVELWVTRYNLNIDYDQMNEKAACHGVSLSYTNATDQNKEQVWIDFKFDLEGKQYWVNSFQRCCMKNCVALKKGKLYTCCIASNIEHFNKYFNQNLEVSEYDYIDINKIEDYDAILKTMIKPIPFCRYCNPKETKYSPWEPSKKDISEWS